MNNPLQPFLERYGVVILDGGLATELERHGANLNDPLWSAKLLIEQPGLIQAVHLDYFRAGADVAITASYQANVADFLARGCSESRALDLIRSSVRLAQHARDAYVRETPAAGGRFAPIIAASIGCYGASLHDGSEYRGDYGKSKAELIAFHGPRMQALAETNPGLFACETIPSLVEAEALTELLSEFPEIPAWISFSCRDDAHVCEGQTLRECFEAVQDFPQIVALGINCTAPRHIEPLLESVQGITTKPLVVYPNSGEHWDQTTRAWVNDPDAIDFTSLAPSWYRLGARLIGGCCRTTPETIRGLANALRHHE